MATRKELLSEFDGMEADRQKLLKKLSGNSESTLEKKPSPNEWSVTEVIYHLIVAEGGALKYMQKKLEVGGHDRAKANAGFKQRFLNFMISLPVKYKAPKVVELPKDTKVTFPQALSEWNEIRNGLRKEYESVDEQLIGNELFKHPLMGKMNLVQSVRFMRQHMNRHIGQIERTLEKVK